MREHQEKVPFLYIHRKFIELGPDKLCRNNKIHVDRDKNCVVLHLMGDSYSVYYPGGEVIRADGKEVTSYILKTILLRYLVNGGGMEPTGQFVSYKEIKDGQIYYPNFYARTVLRLAKLYDSNPQLFHDNVKPEMITTSRGDFSFVFEFLPHIYFHFILYRGDDEFPPSATILMDKNIEDYFNAEDLAVVPDVAIEYFVHGGNMPLGLGMYQPGVDQ